MKDLSKATRRLVGQIALAIGFVATGALAVWLGWRVANGLFGLSIVDTAYWSGAAVNVGTTLLLAIALVLFEQRIVNRVDTKVDDTKRQVNSQTERQVGAVREQVAVLTQRAEAIEENLSGINDQFAQAKAARDADQIAKLERLLTDPTHESFRDAMSMAAGAGVVGPFGRSEASFVAPAGAPLTAPRLRVTYSPERMTEDGHSAEHLGLEYESDNPAAQSRAEWAPSESLAVALVSLVAADGSQFGWTTSGGHRSR